MLNKDDEHWLKILANEDVPEADPNIAQKAQALRAAILAEGRLQQLTERLTADGYMKAVSTSKRNMIEHIWNNIKLNFNWQIVPLATVYTVFVIGVTIPIYEQIIVKTLPTEQGIVRSKSLSEPVQSASGMLYGKTPYFKFHYTNSKQIEVLKENFKKAGTEVKVISHQIIEINIPEKPTGNLWQLCDNYGFKVKIIKPSKQFIILPEPRNN